MPKNFTTHEEYLNWYREYRNKNRDKLREYKRIYNQSYRKKIKSKSEAKWNKLNREKTNVHRKVWYAIKIGKMKKSPCNICGSSESVAHHEDYLKPFDVQWLCRVHHYAVHHQSYQQVGLRVQRKWVYN